MKNQNLEVSSNRPPVLTRVNVKIWFSKDKTLYQ